MFFCFIFTLSELVIAFTNEVKIKLKKQVDIEVCWSITNIRNGYNVLRGCTQTQSCMCVCVRKMKWKESGKKKRNSEKVGVAYMKNNFNKSRLVLRPWYTSFAIVSVNEYFLMFCERILSLNILSRGLLLTK